MCRCSGQKPKGTISCHKLHLSLLLLSYHVTLALEKGAVWPEATRPTMSIEPFFGSPASVDQELQPGLWPTSLVTGKDAEFEGGELIFELHILVWNRSSK